MVVERIGGTLIPAGVFVPAAAVPMLTVRPSVSHGSELLSWRCVWRTPAPSLLRVCCRRPSRPGERRPSLGPRALGAPPIG